MSHDCRATRGRRGRRKKKVSKLKFERFFDDAIPISEVELWGNERHKLCFKWSDFVALWIGEAGQVPSLLLSSSFYTAILLYLHHPFRSKPSLCEQHIEFIEITKWSEKIFPAHSHSKLIICKINSIDVESTDDCVKLKLASEMNCEWKATGNNMRLKFDLSYFVFTCFTTPRVHQCTSNGSTMAIMEIIVK